MMLTNSESGRKCRTQTNFKFLKNLNSSAGWRDGGMVGVLAAFPLAFAKNMLGLNLKNANIKTERANKVLKS